MPTKAEPEEKYSIPPQKFECLPRWARVAFAARCARRVQPLFATWPNATEEHKQSVEKAIVCAEQAAREATMKSPSTAKKVAEGASKIRKAAKNDHADTAAFVAAAASAAASEAAYGVAAAASDAASDGTYVPAVIIAAENAAEAGVAVEVNTDVDATANARDGIVEAMLCDLKSLSEAVAEKWPDEQPVAPQFFGSLWPAGEPEGWPTCGD